MFSRIILAFLFVLAPSLMFGDESVGGLYYVTLYHQGTNYFQNAKITLKTINPGGTVKISANVRVFFGKPDSTEYISYDYPDVPLNLLTRQISIQNEGNDVSMVGYLKADTIKGSWYSKQIGEVGSFEAQKGAYPAPPNGSKLLTGVSGHFRGQLVNKIPESNLPERITLSFVTTQGSPGESAGFEVTGNMRFYLGPFGSPEYAETNFKEVNYNFYTRYLTAKTEDYGITLKGTLSYDGVFVGDVFSNGLGNVAEITAKKME